MSSGRRELRSDMEIEDLAEKLLFAPSDKKGRRNNVLVIGAGVSITAGIPDAKSIGKMLLSEIARRLSVDVGGKNSAVEIYCELERQKRFENCRKQKTASLSSVVEGDIDWWDVYDHAFRRYFTQPNDVRALFSSIVDDAGGAINWAHLVIGELVAKGIFSTVLTTNFDQLALAGIVRAGVIPVVCDGLESLNRIDGSPNHPQLIEIHGSRHTYFLRNDRSDVAAVQNEPAAIAAIQSLFHHAHSIVVVGYGGREDGLMDLLIKASEIYIDKNIFWTTYSSSVDQLSPKVRELLAFSRNSAVFTNQDADNFFLNLAKFLKIGSPTAVVSPLSIAGNWISEAQRSTTANLDIKAELDLAADRLANIRKFDDRLGLDPTKSRIADIRAKRLAGQLSGAYEEATKAISQHGALSACPDSLIKEALVVAFEYSQVADSIDPSESALNFAIYLYESSEDSFERMGLLVTIARIVTIIGNMDRKHPSTISTLAMLQDGLSEISADKYPKEWVKIKANVGNSLIRIAGSDDVALAEVLSHYQEVAEFCEKHGISDTWNGAQNSIGNIFLRKARRSKDISDVDEGIGRYRLSLGKRSRSEDLSGWSLVSSNLASALFFRSTLSGSKDDLDASLKHIEDAVNGFRQVGSTYNVEKGGRLMRLIKERLSRYSIAN